jgi:predicted acyl esterase
VLSLEPVTDEIGIQYNAITGLARFRFTFDEPTELTGYFKLKVWVGCDGHDDLDLQVHTYKLDSTGQRVHFAGVMGDINEGVSKGFFRVSHRVSLVPERSTAYRPYYSHEASLPLPAGEFVPVDVPMHPSSTIFHAGESLELIIAGHDVHDFYMLRRARQSNSGTHRLMVGGSFDSHLLIPRIPRD